MKGLMVYHSKWGNCRKIAESIARGLEEAGHEITVEPAEEKKLNSDFDFIAVGGPTRIGKMTSAMRRFLRREIKDGWSGKPFIAFGTGGKSEGDSRTDKWCVKGAERIYDALLEKGLKPVADPFKAYVEDIKGPLEDGSEERALEFGRSAGSTLIESAT